MNSGRTSVIGKYWLPSTPVVLALSAMTVPFHVARYLVPDMTTGIGAGTPLFHLRRRERVGKRRLALERGGRARRQVGRRVHGLLVYPQLEVKVGTRRVAGRSLESDRGPLRDGLAHLDQRGGEVAVERVQASGVDDHDEDAVAASVVPDRGDDAVIRREHG